MSARKEQWILATEAAAIMSENSGHPVSPDYVRLLSNQGKIRARARDGRTKEYLKSDVQEYQVRGKGINKQTAKQPSNS